MSIHSQKKATTNKQRRLKSRWYNGLSEGEIEEFEKRLFENEDLLRQLATIVEQKVESNNKIRRDRNAYDKPAFSEFQADCNGYERALEEVLDYLKITKET